MQQSWQDSIPSRPNTKRRTSDSALPCNLTVQTYRTTANEICIPITLYTPSFQLVRIVLWYHPVRLTQSSPLVALRNLTKRQRAILVGRLDSISKLGTCHLEVTLYSD